jgi:hypothetical protein
VGGWEPLRDVGSTGERENLLVISQNTLREKGSKIQMNKADEGSTGGKYHSEFFDYILNWSMYFRNAARGSVGVAFALCATVLSHTIYSKLEPNS